jgi:glycerol-1-phosphatase
MKRGRVVPAVTLSPLAARYDQLILDLDGCVWVGREPIAGSVQAVEALRAAGKRVAFVTNDPRSSSEDYVRDLWGVGIQASLADVVTVGAATQHLLAETRPGRTAFVIGTEALHDHVAGAGLKVMNGTDLASRAEVVVIGGTEDLVFAELRDATLAVRRGADLLATGRDPTYPTPEGLLPGTGAIVAAVEYATGQTAAIVGKPEPQLFHTAIDRLGEAPTLVVGDRLDADIAAAARAGLDSALVLSGGTSAAEAQEAERARKAGDPAPVAVADTLAALVLRPAGP